MLLSNICQICLRTDKNLKLMETELSELYDELCEFSSMMCSMEPQYCGNCEHMLRKVYNFRQKCCKASKILNNWKRSKIKKEELYTLLPPTSFGIWDESKTRIYEFIHEDEPKSSVSSTGGEGDSILPKKIKLELDFTDEAIDFKEETEQHFDELNYAVDTEDPLINRDAIKTEVNVEDSKATEANGKPLDKCSIISPLFIPCIKNNIREETMHDNFVNKEEREPDSMLKKLERMLGDVDDGSLNSDDDCDSDDFILNDTIFNRKKMANGRKKNAAENKRGLEKSKQCATKKKTLLELTNMSVDDLELDSDYDESDVNNVKSNPKVPKKVNQAKALMKPVIDREQSNQKIKDAALQKVNKFLRKVRQIKQKGYNKERLKANMITKFETCGELKAEDGTVIDKDTILQIIDEAEPNVKMRRLWDQVRDSTTLTSKTVSLLKFMQKESNQYKTVFHIQYLSTKEARLEEFEKRRTYEAYLESDYNCDHCHQWFKYKKSLENHMKCHDVSAGDFVCEICKTRKKTKFRYWHHVSLHKMVYKCKLCPLVTNYRYSMVNHYHKHQGVMFNCEHCNVTFRSKSAYMSHRQSSCRERPRTHVCTRCARTFHSGFGLMLHTGHKHPDDPPVDEATSIKCSHCELKFPTEEVCMTHLRISHGQEDTPMHLVSGKRKANRKPRKGGVFICRVCNAKGPAYGWLCLHFQLEHPEVDRRALYADKTTHLCEVCGKGYASRLALRNHLTVHSSERRHACAQCGARLRTAAALAVHRQMHAPRRHQCTRCPAKFKQRGHLYVHTRAHIGNRCFKCPICGKGFLHSSTMREHVRGVHHNIKRVKKRGAPRVEAVRKKKKCEQSSDSN